MLLKSYLSSDNTDINNNNGRLFDSMISAIASNNNL